MTGAADPLIWRLALPALAGVVFGLGLYTFLYAEGTSYLSNDPLACANCHVMREEYDGWRHSSHKAVATCNDCHTPHDPVGKWVTKARNGWNHSLAFTTGRFDEPIRIKPGNLATALANCAECHETLVNPVHSSPTGENLSCTACHGNVGHGW